MSPRAAFAASRATPLDREEWQACIDSRSVRRRLHIVSRGGGAWSIAAGEAANAARGLTLEAFTFGQELRDPENSFAAAYGITAKGAVLVRPDGFVAWRAKSSGTKPQDLARLLCN